MVSRWAAVALTSYMGSQYLVLNYMRSRSHVMPLWFNGIANAILWFTFIKAFWRSVLGFMGKAITFKTTLKVRPTERDRQPDQLFWDCIWLISLWYSYVYSSV